MIWLIAGAVVIVLAAVVLFKAPVRLIRSLDLLASAACMRRDWVAAANYYREAHEVAGKLKELGKSKIEPLIELKWANVLHRQGKMREADEMYRTGFSKASHSTLNEFQVIQEGHLNYGDLCTDEGRYCDAERHYRKALEANESTGNLGLMIFDLQRLGDSLIRQGRREEAEETINRAIVLETQVVHAQLLRSGQNPAETPIISMSMPDLHFCREQYEDASRVYRQKVEYWETQVTRPDNIDLGHLQMRLAFAEAQTGRHKEAIEMYTRAEATFQREWREGHPKAVAAREAKDLLLRDTLTIRH